MAFLVNRKKEKEKKSLWWWLHCIKARLKKCLFTTSCLLSVHISLSLQFASISHCDSVSVHGSHSCVCVIVCVCVCVCFHVWVWVCVCVCGMHVVIYVHTISVFDAYFYVSYCIEMDNEHFYRNISELPISSFSMGYLHPSPDFLGGIFTPSSLT